MTMPSPLIIVELAQLPLRLPPRRGSGIHAFALLIAALVTTGGLPAFAAQSHRAVNLYSIPQEIALGRQMGG